MNRYDWAFTVSCACIGGGTYSIHPGLTVIFIGLLIGAWSLTDYQK